MILKISAFSILLSFSLTLVAEGKEPVRASDVFEWPPGFEAMFGDPAIRVLKGTSRRGFGTVVGAGRYNVYDGVMRGEQPSWVTVWVPRNASAAQVNEVAAEALARSFYSHVLHPRQLSRYEDLFGFRELIAMDKERFCKIAKRRLLGGATGSAGEDAWWNIRMGIAGEVDSTHQLVIFNQHWQVTESDKDSYGHFCFGLRKKGGDAQRDIVLDFRAPWFEDRRASTTEAVNLHNRLKIDNTIWNMYDWLYSQTEHRGCYVNCWFIPVTKDQVTLIRHYVEVGNLHLGGNFRPFRKNCASIGQLFLNRLGPFTDGIVASRPPSIDMPKVIAQKIVAKYDDAPFFQVTDVTDERGRFPTAKSHIFRAQPSRETCRPFLLMRAEPSIN